MLRKKFLLACVVLGLLLTACGGSDGPKTYTVGVMVELPWLVSIYDNFKSSMAELGYVEGENITYIHEVEAGSDLATFEDEANRLREQGVDMIFTVGTLTTVAAKNAVEGTDIPVLFTPVINPIGEGIVESVRRPGGNVTGVQVVDQSPKALEWLLKVAPEATKVYVPYNPADEVTAPIVDNLHNAVPELGIELLPGEASSVEEMLTTVKSLPEGTVIFLVVPMPSLEPGVEELGQLALERNIPVGVYNRLINDPPFPVVTFSVDVSEEAKQGARMADQIFKGAEPATLPVETAEYFLTINLKKAQEIDLQIPDDVLRQADTVVR